MRGKDIWRAFNEQMEVQTFSFEMRTKGAAIVGGVKGVEISSPDKISLRLVGGGAMLFNGEGLCCTSFGNRSVEISGKIAGIIFEAV
ncbi:MAG: YabP/YqfC family sporulation protein [Clostridia bacterium]|nr:YabP/YqfC family sporulation protein [Clostridia bacterium]